MNQAPQRFSVQSPQQAMDRANRVVGDAMCSAADTIKSNPATAVFTAFGAGLGLGLGLALVFGGSSAPPPGIRDQFVKYMNEHLPAWAKNAYGS
jgi:hypothetical protein